jgi:hypothetical protein
MKNRKKIPRNNQSLNFRIQNFLSRSFLVTFGSHDSEIRPDVRARALMKLLRYYVLPQGYMRYVQFPINGF